MAIELLCSNASPLRHLGRLKETDSSFKALDLLRVVAKKICISEQVQIELMKNSFTPKITIDFIQDNELIVVENVINQKYLDELKYAHGTGLGERSTLVVVKQLNAPDALLANNGAEVMFDAEGVSFTNLYDFLDSCVVANIICENEYCQMVRELYRPNKKTGYRPKKYRPLFKKLRLE
jgi:hypothetical protein